MLEEIRATSLMAGQEIHATNGPAWLMFWLVRAAMVEKRRTLVKKSGNGIGVDVAKKGTREPSTGGGLRNVQERLQTIYRGQAIMDDVPGSRIGVSERQARALRAIIPCL